MRILGVIGLMALTSAAAAQDRGLLSSDCRREVIQLCGLDRSSMRTCIVDNRDKLSAACRGELKSLAAARTGAREVQDRQAPPETQGAPGKTEHAYGPDPLQRLDFYAARAAGAAPLVVFVHGGGWKRGDKGNATGAFKAKHYRDQSYAFASINYRLVPTVKVEQQAADVAASLAWLIQNAAKLGIDPKRIALMGHSAGAHLAALVGTDPQYLRAAGLDMSAVRGVLPIDGAAYDVAAQLGDRPAMMKRTYADAFGNDPARHKALSPTHNAGSPNAPAFLIIHVERPDAVRQSQALASALRSAGTVVELKAFEGQGLMGHMEINRRLGDPSYPATPVVDAWLRQVLK